MSGGSFSRTAAGNQAYFAMQLFFVLGHHSTLLPTYEEHCVVAAKDTKKPLAQFSDMALSHTFTLDCPHDMEQGLECVRFHCSLYTGQSLQRPRSCANSHSSRVEDTN